MNAIHMIFFRLFIIGVGLAAAVTAVAQADVEKIKNDPNYKWGEGSGITFEDADNAALAALSRNIWTVIVGSATETGSAVINNGEVSSENKQDIFLKSFTINTIPDAKLVVLSPEPDCRVFRYVHASAIDSMKTIKKRHVNNYIETGKSAEKNLQIDDALRCYYWALMLAQANTEPVYIDFDGKPTDCRTYIPLKIKSVISRIKSELVECAEQDGRYLARLRFTYNGFDIASLQVWYNDGHTYVGPVTVRDGVGEFDLLALPAKKKISLRYEYRFKDEACNLDPELEAAFASIKPYVVNANADVPVKVNEKKGTVAAAGTAVVQVAMGSGERAVAPEPVRKKERMALNEVSDNSRYQKVLADIERAIDQGNPLLVKDYFDPGSEGYKMFVTLLTKTGKVSLSGQQKYEFIEGNGFVLARFCRIKIKFSNGKSFMENIVFRFLPATGKIESIAMALTKKAEDDIFSASLMWPEVSKFTIQRFMEDYRTAYALKRLDYIEQIFSDHALIITGSVLAPTRGLFDEVKFDLGSSTNVRYTRQNKSQYLARLKRQFREREYIHLTFEDNITGPINTQGVLKNGAAFGIQIKQIYSSPVYSDRGYLSLFLNMQGKWPVIEVRFWQPESEEMIGFSDFQKVFQVK